MLAIFHLFIQDILARVHTHLRLTTVIIAANTMKMEKALLSLIAVTLVNRIRQRHALIHRVLTTTVCVKHFFLPLMF